MDVPSSCLCVCTYNSGHERKIKIENFVLIHCICDFVHASITSDMKEKLILKDMYRLTGFVTLEVGPWLKNQWKEFVFWHVYLPDGNIQDNTKPHLYELGAKHSDKIIKWMHIWKLILITSKEHSGTEKEKCYFTILFLFFFFRTI